MAVLLPAAATIRKRPLRLRHRRRAKKDSVTTETTEPEETEPELVGFEPVTAEFSQGTVEILGAESFWHEEQEYDVLRVYYRFTNQEENSNSAEVLCKATQGGSELSGAYVVEANKIPEDTYLSLIHI